MAVPGVLDMVTVSGPNGIGWIAIPPGLRGDQRPRLWAAPPRYSDTVGRECTDFAAAIGYGLDDWQEWQLTEALGTRQDGTWAAFEVAEILSRQNGKNVTVEVRQLFGLFVLSEPLLIHTAHEFKAAEEHFLRIRDRIDQTESLSRRVKTVTTSHGMEAIVLKRSPALIFGPGKRQVRRSVAPRLRFLARSRGSGRSFTCDCLTWDEAMILSDDQVQASMPTMSAVANPQLWYLASAGYPDSTQLAMIRRRGVRADAARRAGTPADPDLAFFEWSVDPHNELCPRDERAGRRSNRFIVCGEHDDRDDPRSWAKANPALGIRITPEHVLRELNGMSPDAFDIERLGAGQWPTDEEGWAVITEAQWDACEVEARGGMVTPVCFAADVTPDLSAASISVAWERPSDGRIIIEQPRGDCRDGTAWVVPRLKQLRQRWHPMGIALPRTAPATGLIDDAERNSLEITKASALDEAAAFTLMVTGIHDRKTGHLGPADAPFLRSAVAGAVTRDTGDGLRGWSRKNSAVNITPLTSGTLAYWLFNKLRRSYDPVGSLGYPKQRAVPFDVG